MTVFTYENSRRGEACRDFIMSSSLPSKCETTTILPIPTTRDGVHLTGSDKTLASLVTEACEGEIYLGYSVPSWVSMALRDSGATVVDASSDEEFLIENARLTALGTLAYLLSLGAACPDAFNIAIVGYGRIGKALTRMLLSLGCPVRIYSTRREVVLCLAESGTDASLAAVGDPIPECDILINTAPAVIFDTSRYDGRTRILELASGDNFPNVDFIRLPALPNRYFPISAGRAYGAALIRALGGKE